MSTGGPCKSAPPSVPEPSSSPHPTTAATAANETRRAKVLGLGMRVSRAFIRFLLPANRLEQT